MGVGEIPAASGERVHMGGNSLRMSEEPGPVVQVVDADHEDVRPGRLPRAPTGKRKEQSKHARGEEVCPIRKPGGLDGKIHLLRAFHSASVAGGC